MTSEPRNEGPGAPPSLSTATKAWAAISLQTFGGPAGQIAVMQRSLVDEHRWISQQRFLFALSYCTLLPGPEAQQLATYIGWLLHGLRGALIAGTLFVIPGVVTMLALSAVYVTAGDTTFVESLFLGLAPAVIAIVVHALIRIGRRSLTHPGWVAIAVAAFVAITAFGVPFPLVVLAAALAGWSLGRRHPEIAEANAIDDSAPAPQASSRRTALLLTLGIPLWLAPVGIAAVVFGRDSIVVDEGLFFSGSALITFGGAYAVLAFVAQQAVAHYGWLTTTDMVRGLALAETTPGPLIMVVQFVAFVGAFRHAGDANPWAIAIAASLVTSWVTFAPSFLFIAVGAPYVERLQHLTGLRSALAGVTAAVVGVIASLALYFALHTLFADLTRHTWGLTRIDVPVLSSVHGWVAAIAVIGFVLVLRGWGVLRILGVCAVLGLTVGLVAGAV
ncbi:MAG TPA: chromate efflux transporter [Aeromicrobium sp.]|nr:chromate efflux transporter [Aeromicrobium sp.]